MKYYRPFCKINASYTTGPFEVLFQDSAGSTMDCNYINVGIAGSLNVQDVYVLELIGTSGLQSYLYNFSNATTSGGFVTSFTHYKPAEIILPAGITATGVRINRWSGTLSRAVYVNYGVLKEEASPFKSRGKYKGV